MTTEIKTKIQMPTCEVCKKEQAVGVCCVPGVPYSAAYCKTCLDANAHPYFIVVANTACIGGLEHSAPWWQDIVRDTLVHLGKTPEEFKADVDKSIADGPKEADMSRFKHGAMAINATGDILHFCAYESRPTGADMESLKQELNTDPEFDLVGRVGVDVTIVEATPEVCKLFLEPCPHQEWDGIPEVDAVCKQCKKDEHEVDAENVRRGCAPIAIACKCQDCGATFYRLQAVDDNGRPMEMSEEPTCSSCVKA
jgi:hypothetical protein